MKKYAVLFLLLFAGLVAQASAVTFAWDPSPDVTVTSYTLRWGTTPGGPYPFTNFCGLVTTVSVNNTNLIAATNYFVVTASDGTQDSDPSNEVMYVRPPRPASGLKKVAGASMGFTALLLPIYAMRLRRKNRAW